MVSVAALQAWLKVEGEDALLSRLEAGIVAFLEAETGRLFTSPASTITEILDGMPWREDGLLAVQARPWAVELREAPIGAVTSIRYRADMASAWVAQTLGDFEVQDRLLYDRRNAWPYGDRTVEVVYPFGYAVDGGPADAHLLILQMAKALWERRDAGIIESAGVGPLRISYASFAADGGEIKMGIDALRRPLGPG